MLSKALVFVFTTFGVFAVLMGFMTPQFITETFNPSYVDPQVRQTFEAADVMVYDNLGADNMTYQYSSLNPPDLDGDGNDADWSAGLPSGQYFEVWWSEVAGFWGVRSLEMRHTTKVWYGWAFVNLQIKYLNGSWIGISPGSYSIRINKAILENGWSAETNCSGFYASGPVTVSILFMPTDQSKTIGQAWDDGHISYMFSYEVNWNSTGLNAWNIVGQILSFQIPNLGVPGIAGTIIGLIISFPYYSLIAYIVYKLIAGLIPFLSGGSGD